MLTETRTGRVPVIAYVCTSDPDISDLITDYLHRYASARDWPVVDVVTDTDRRRPRDKRPGWRRALLALADGEARGVVTYSVQMLAPDAAAFETLRLELGDSGRFLTAVRPATAPAEGLPRRTPGDTARRRELADTAAGIGWDAFTPRLPLASGGEG